MDEWPQARAEVMASADMLERLESERAELLEALRLAHPLLIRLGDFIANGENRCDAVLAVANAIARAEGGAK